MKTITTKANKLTKGCKLTKKTILTVVTAAIMCCMCSVNVFAAGGAVETGTFIDTAGTVLKSVICLIGGGLGVWGVVNLLEGYGNDNPGAKSQGMKQLMSGLGLILLGMILVDPLINMMKNAM